MVDMMAMAQEEDHSFGEAEDSCFCLELAHADGFLNVGVLEW